MAFMAILTWRETNYKTLAVKNLKGNRLTTTAFPLP
jgi:hypothetical protein